MRRGVRKGRKQRGVRSSRSDDRGTATVAAADLSAGAAAVLSFGG
jgi:hypothetical protein